VLKVAENIKNLQLDTAIAGISINTSPTDHRPMESMQPVQYDGKAETYVPISDVIKAGNDKKL